MVQTRAATRRQQQQQQQAQEVKQGTPGTAAVGTHEQRGRDEADVLECDCHDCRAGAEGGALNPGTRAQKQDHNQQQRNAHTKHHSKQAPVPAHNCSCIKCIAARENAAQPNVNRVTGTKGKKQQQQQQQQQQQANAQGKTRQNNNNNNRAKTQRHQQQQQVGQVKGGNQRGGASAANANNRKNAQQAADAERGDSALANAKNADAEEEDDNASDQGFVQPPETVSVDGSPVYRVDKRLGKGGFGQVFIGVRVDSDTKPETKIEEKSDDERPVNDTSKSMAGMPRALDSTGCRLEAPDQLAIKFEHSESKSCVNGPPGEWDIYSSLSGVYGVPKVYYKGQCGSFYVMMMDILGPSLWDRWNASDKKMSVEEVACVTVEGLSILYSFHNRGYVHGDIKPENFLLGQEGTSAERNLFLVDLGLAAPWRVDDLGGRHIMYDQRPDQFRGTVRYASVHAHLGRTLSRRDDLESLAYTVLFLLKGQLPWQGFGGEHKGFLVCKKKMSMSPEALCHGLPDAFRQFVQAVVNLRFDEEPAYHAMAQLFDGLMSENNAQRPLSTNGMERVAGRKRKAESIDVHEKDENGNARKKVRCGSPCLQWITVYDENIYPVKQRYLFGVTSAKFDQHVRKGMNDEPKLFIAAVDGGQGETWSLVLDNSQRYRDQTWKLSFNQFLPKDWIVSRWEEGYYITAVGGGANFNSVVAMSKGTRFTQQSYKVSDSFPFKWIAKKWREGYFVTSMATSNSRWAVVMSRNSGFSDQRVELDFMYPSEGIHKRWDEGWRITCCAATPDQSAFVLSQGKGMRTQETLRTSDFPSEHVQSKWERGLFISDVAYGRTQS